MTDERLPIIRPDVSFAAVAADIEAVLDSGHLTTGPYLARFEAALAEAVGAPHAIATTSATTALHLALVGAGVEPGDEVLVSDFTFPATGNVVVQMGAVPVLVDSRAEGYDLDIEEASAKVTARTRAILPVDPFGQPADLDGVAALAEAHGLAIVEDAACALGSVAAGRPVGARPWAACFSFHPRKVVTTGEGGAVTLHDDDQAVRLRRLRSHGGVLGPVGMRFTDNGFNYRLPELSAVLGLEQLGRLDEIVGDRRCSAAGYDERLAGAGAITVARPRPGEIWSQQSYVVLLADGVDRDAVSATLRDQGIETTLGTYAMHAHPAFARFGWNPGDLPRSWTLQRQTLTLPLVPRMTEADLDRVAEALIAAVAAHRGGATR